MYEIDVYDIIKWFAHIYLHCIRNYIIVIHCSH